MHVGEICAFFAVSLLAPQLLEEKRGGKVDAAALVGVSFAEPAGIEVNGRIAEALAFI